MTLIDYALGTSAESMRANFPAPRFRVSENRLAPYVALTASGAAGVVCVFEGECRIGFGGVRAHLAPGQLLWVPGGDYRLSVGPAGAVLVHLWDLSALMAVP